MIASIPVADEVTMLALGEKIARLLPMTLPQALLFFLEGELGAGKTTFTRGFLRGCGYRGYVKSPTYTLIESYHLANYSVFHLDLYRIHDPRELDYIGIQDCFTENNAIILIEWAENANGTLREADVIFHIDFCGENINQRIVKYIAQTPIANAILKK